MSYEKKRLHDGISDMCLIESQIQSKMQEVEVENEKVGVVDHCVM